MKFFRRSEEHDFVVSIATKAIFRMPRADYAHSGLFGLFEHRAKDKGSENARFRAKAFPFHKKGAGMCTTLVFLVPTHSCPFSWN
jgi:hypothetical protein